MPHFKNANNELFWLDEGDNPDQLLQDCTPISDDEADAIRASIKQAAMNALNYADKRAAEYPPMADYLDGIVKGNNTQVNSYISACLAIKAKYPKT